MKIIIEHKGLKRSIEGTGFNICASPQDLLTIADTITRENPTNFGWLKIRDPIPDDHSATKTQIPLAWDK